MRRGLLGLGVRRQGRRDRRGHHPRGRGGALRAPRLPVHPSGAAREPRRARGRAGGDAAAARRAGRPARRPPCAHDLVGRREGELGGDGARGQGARLPLPRRHRPLALPARGRMEAQDRELDALNERLAPFRLLKGVEANIKADGSIDVDDETLGTRDWVIASLHTSFDKSPTERVLGAMENPHVDCIGHLTGAQDRQARGRCARLRARGREGTRDAAPCSRSTRSPTGWTCRISLARLAGEAGVPITSRATRTGSRRSPMSRSASPGAPGLADEAAHPEHAHRGRRSPSTLR